MNWEIQYYDNDLNDSGHVIDADWEQVEAPTLHEALLRINERWGTALGEFDNERYAWRRPGSKKHQLVRIVSVRPVPSPMPIIKLEHE